MLKEDKILITIIIVCIVVLIATVVFSIVNYKQTNKEPNNATARFVVGEDNVTAIELVYAQTHQMVDELILYKDDTGLARSGNQHIYINKSSCKIIVYRGE